MAVRSQTICLLALAVLLVGAAGVRGHASTKLRGILGSDAPGSGQAGAIGLGHSTGAEGDVSMGLTCPAGQTLKIGTLDAAQNPSCVKCGGQLQFACNGSTCKPGLVVLDSPAAVQPICIPSPSFKPRKITKAASGRSFTKGAAATATFSATKALDCGMHGLPCCAAAPSCDLGLTCSTNTCIVSQ